MKNDENGVLTINGGDFSQYLPGYCSDTEQGGHFLMVRLEPSIAEAKAVLFTAKYLESRAVGGAEDPEGGHVCVRRKIRS